MFVFGDFNQIAAVLGRKQESQDRVVLFNKILTYEHTDVGNHNLISASVCFKTTKAGIGLYDYYLGSRKSRWWQKKELIDYEFVHIKCFNKSTYHFTTSIILFFELNV